MRLLLVLGMLLLTSVYANAETPYSAPVLLTSGGQSADALFMKNVLTKEGIEFQYKPLATVADLDSVKSMIIVIGGSSKGLGAARISTEEEIARMTALLEAAAKKKLPIITAHLGGKSRRGSLSDPFNEVGLQNASKLFVVKGGDDDGFFQRRADKRGIPYQMINVIADVGAPLKALYTVPAGQ